MLWLLVIVSNQQFIDPDNWTIDELWYHPTILLIAIVIPSLIAIIAVIVFILSDFGKLYSLLLL